MAEERSDIVIEGNQATWEIRTEGLIQGTYSGTFRFRCFLNPMQQVAAGRDYREMMGPNMGLAPEHESFLAWSLCQLKYRIISAPPFWGNESGIIGGGNLPDEEIVPMVLDAAMAAENKYKDSLRKRKEEAIKRAKMAGEAILKDRKAAPEEDEE